MTRVVIDTNVLVAALRPSRGASFKLLSLVAAKAFETVVSVPLVIEYEHAAVRTSRQVGLVLPAVSAILDYLCKVSLHQEVFFLWRPILRDPNDDMVLELAVAASADGIVTFNKKDFVEAGSFGLSILSPKEFLEKEGLL